MIALARLPRWTASPFAQAHLARWLRRRRPASVLEIGGGSGTLTRVGRAAAPIARWVAVEPIEAFRLALPCEAWAVAGPGLKAFEGVVLDGEPSPDWGALERARWAFVEGNRREQRAELLRAWPGALQWQRRPWDRSKGAWLVVRHPILRDRTEAVLAWVLEALKEGVARAGGYSRRGKRR